MTAERAADLTPKAARAFLDYVLTLYWDDSLTQQEAAFALGMRKTTFAELADLKRCVSILERLVRAYLGDAFNAAFPWCDAQAIRDGAEARVPPCANPNHGRKAGKRETELLTPPQRYTMRELVPTTRRADAEVARYLRKNPTPMWQRFPDPVETGTENEVPELKLS